MYNHQSWSSAPMTEPSNSPKNRRMIEVTGRGTISAAPDRALVVLGAITDNLSLNTAQKDNAVTVSNIIDALLKLNIPKQHIQTVNYRIEIQYHYEDGKQIFRGYKVTHMLQVTVDNMEQTGLVVDTAVAQGANSVSNVQFAMAYPDLYYNQALSAAIANARHKAMTIANTLGVTLIVIPDLVQEESRSQEPIPYQPMLYAESTATPIQPGELKISANVKVHYSYY